jgi:hypothetical protein
MIQKKHISRDTYNIKYLLVCFTIKLFFISNPAFSESTNTQIRLNANYNKLFPVSFQQEKTAGNSANFQNTMNFNNFTSKVSLNFSNKNKLIYDHSFAEFKYRNKTFGIGKIDRKWSFSPISSLILSNNARPTDSIYYIYENKKSSDIFLTSWAGPSSFEVFNSITSDKTKVNNSMLLGLRLVIEPVNNLMFELVKTSQWGGDGQTQNLSSLKAAIAGNTNSKSNSNINQLAGYGFSYFTDIKEIPSRFYAQVVGEDEAGNLPSCNMHLFGSELDLPANKIFSKLGFEFIDTRIDWTTNGNCGPNTAYNNNIYSYSNYGKTIGTSIDTESKSFNAWASKQISEDINVSISIKDITINDANWSSHRLSSSKVNGIQASIETSFHVNSFNIESGLSYQNFVLDKENHNNGLSLYFSTAYVF